MESGGVGPVFWTKEDLFCTLYWYLATSLERAMVSPPWLSKECETSALEVLMLQSGLLGRVHVFLSSRGCRPNPQLTAFPAECT